MKQYTAHCQSGYYQYDRIVMVDKKLPDHEYMQAGIILHNNGEMLVSYETIVAEITDGWVHFYGTFSRTTAKHIGIWAKRFGLTYQFIKNLYEKNLEYNIYDKTYRPAVDGMIQTIGIRA